jgi:hypothetical protein
MEFTTRFELQSQATRLIESAPYAKAVQSTDGVITLTDVLFQGTSLWAKAGSSF